MQFLFDSDNTAPVAPQIMDALAACNRGFQDAYGEDELSRRVNAAYSEVFERAAHVFAVPTGTAGNGLALGAITPPYGAIFCHRRAHIVTTECGAPEFYSGGGRLELLDGVHNKITPDALKQALAQYADEPAHRMLPAALSLTQATERGVVYTPDELQALSAIAHDRGMKVHLDGARFANAMVHLGVSAAAMTWKAGIDIVTFGTTKNGTMNAEAVVAFDADLARVLRLMHKRAGHLYSKMRYMSAQLLSYLDNDLWLDNAARANDFARRLGAIVRDCPGAEVAHPIDINEVFAIFPPDIHRALARAGIALLPWDCDGNGNGSRMVASYCEEQATLDKFAAALENTGEDN